MEGYGQVERAMAASPLPPQLPTLPTSPLPVPYPCPQGLLFPLLGLPGAPWPAGLLPGTRGPSVSPAAPPAHSSHLFLSPPACEAFLEKDHIKQSETSFIQNEGDTKDTRYVLLES